MPDMRTNGDVVQWQDAGLSSRRREFDSRHPYQVLQETTMSTHLIGERVGAILSGDEKTVKFLGYGTYDGYCIPEPNEGVKFMGVPMEHANPRITLDSGKHVYGCECWWGSEERVKRMLEGKTVENVDIEVERANHAGVEECSS